MRNTLQKNKVVLGFSGGVDSTVAALLLKEQGFQVIGFYFDIFNGESSEYHYAQKIAKELDIHLVYENVSKEFEDIIIKDFCNQYQKGRTPNPCIICNPLIKFQKLIEVADKNDAFYIATGHYAQIIKDDENHFVGRALNERKDQSYMLYRLNQNILSRLIFPLGQITDKETIRNLAKKSGLSNSDKKDSQEICFVPEGQTYIDILDKKNVKSSPGNFMDKNGKILGEHKGITHYTIGQRKGLGIALGTPVFVTKIDAKSNSITLGPQDDLMNRTVSLIECYFSETESKEIPEKYLNSNLKGKSRYASPLADCKIIRANEKEVTIEFSQPQKSFTPGQSVVLYCDDKVLGGGFIK